MHEEITHPCVQHKLALIRDEVTGYKKFRELATEITMFLCYEALKEIEVKQVTVQTPLAKAVGYKIANELVVVPILRAGAGMLEGILDLVPTARVGFVGMYRDAETKAAVSYYHKLPKETKGGTCIVIDPMIATGGSTAATIEFLKEEGAGSVVVICIVACPYGIAAVEAEHPDVKIFTAAVDDQLDDRKYIVPGLGDAGDRLFGTR
ncbi:MAG: uracil phosphoribosyltransferase [Woeseia sp.]